MKKQIVSLTAAAFLTFGVGGVAVAQYDSVEPDTSTEVDTADTTAGEDTTVQIQTDVEPGQGADDDATRSQRDGRGHRVGCNLDAAADAIGITTDELRAELDTGASIADVAAANGVSADAVVDAMVEAKQERIAEKVAEGRITQERADEKLEDLEQRYTDRVNGLDTDGVGA